MAKKSSLFTIDWECWDSFRAHTEWKNVDLIEEPTMYLLDLLRRHQIKAIWYCVGWLIDNSPLMFEAIKLGGHIIGNHTYYHDMDMADHPWKPSSGILFRAPRWENEKRLYSGGFWHRAMPYWWIKREVQKTEILFLHPHDLMFEHPECGLRTFDRRIGLKTSRDKLERLCRELEWCEPQTS